MLQQVLQHREHERQRLPGAGVRPDHHGAEVDFGIGTIGVRRLLWRLLGRWGGDGIFCVVGGAGRV